MKNNLKRFIASTIALSVIGTSGATLDVFTAKAYENIHEGKKFAREIGLELKSEEAASELNELAELNHNKAPKIKKNDDESIKQIDSKLSNKKVKSDKDAKGIIKNISELLGVKNINQELKFVSSSDSLYNTVYTFKQYYKDIELVNSYVSITVDKETGESEFLNSSFVSDFSIDIQPDVSASNAAQIVMSQYSVSLAEAPKLVIYSADNTDHKLAWQVTTDSFAPSMVYVDAENGEILYEEMPTAANDEGDIAATYSLREYNPFSSPFTVDIARDKNNTSLYKLHDTKRNIYVLDSSQFYYTSNNELKSKSGKSDDFTNKSFVISKNNNSWSDYGTELGVLYNVQQAYDFYEYLSWTGTDDQNSDLFIIPQLRTENGNGVDNAFAMGASNSLAFGAGNENNVGSYDDNKTRNWGLSYDVAVHEYTHRVTKSKVRWYGQYGEAAALNEAYSDIMGEYADGTDEWQQGTYHYLNGVSYVRDLSDPNSDPYQYYKYTTPGHFKDVECHAGSTVISHAAYLMYKLGIPDYVAKKLWFVSLDYMPQFTNATFSDCRNAILKAADKVFDTYSYSKRLEWAYSIKKAFNAVNVLGEYDLVGDVNLDNNIDENDITALENYLNGKFSFTQPVQEYYCDLTGDGVINNSDVTYLRDKVLNKVKITKQPTSTTKNVGETAQFSVTTQGNGRLFQWYIKESYNEEFRPATKYDNTTGSSSPYNSTLNFKVTPSSNGTQFYCVITDKYNNKAVTDTVTLEAINSFSVYLKPEPNITASKYGEVVTLCVGAEGDNLEYLWFIQYPYMPKPETTSNKTNTFQITMTEANNGIQVWCRIFDAYGNVETTPPSTITVSNSAAASTSNTLTIVSQPKNASAAIGSTVKTTVQATGEGLSYQWYVKNPGMTTFAKSSIKKATYAFSMTAAMSGRQVYCVITDKNGNSIKSNTATLGIPAEITAQPVNAVAAIGSTVKTTVQATGDGLQYQWYVKNPGATKFTKSSITSATYSYEMTSAKNGRQVYCIVSDQYGNFLNTIFVTLATPLKVTKQPANASAAIGSTVKTSVTASGYGLTYQWYYCNPGSTTFKKSSVKSSVYSTTMTAAMSGRLVYCVITDSCGRTVETETVALTKK